MPTVYAVREFESHRLRQDPIALALKLGMIATPEVEGLPVVRRWHVVNKLSKTLSPAAEAFRYFVLERGEAQLAAIYGSRGVRGQP